VHLIDPMLAALGWQVRDPRQMIQEARSQTAGPSPERLYFDYLGMAQGRSPVLSVEAKGLDAGLPRPPYKPAPGARMPDLISAALAAIKARLTGAEDEGNKKRPEGLVSQWSDWLQDQQTYVASLTQNELMTLRRLVITSGRWMILFADPEGAFIAPGAPDPGKILCFISFAEIIEGHARLFELLRREHLVDTLPLTFRMSEGLGVVDPTAVTQRFRGAVVATSMCGPAKKRYPTRTVHPAVIVVTGGRDFAIVDYSRAGAEEPIAENRDQYPEFLEDLAQKGERHEQEVLRALGLENLALSQVADFATLAPNLAAAAEPGTTGAILAERVPALRAFVRPTGELQGDDAEYLVVTGEDWFYKRETPFGAACALHSFPQARREGVVEGAPHEGDTPTRAARAVVVRDAALPLIRARGKPFGPGLLFWQSGDWSAVYRTPFSRLNICNPTVKTYREAVILQEKPINTLPYGLDIFRSKKFMSIQWGDESLQLLSFSSGIWDRDLGSYLKSECAIDLPELDGAARTSGHVDNG
jgi:hypothetical protein